MLAIDVLTPYDEGDWQAVTDQEHSSYRAAPQLGAAFT
jgi:hypothetical protein